MIHVELGDGHVQQAGPLLAAIDEVIRQPLREHDHGLIHQAGLDTDATGVLWSRLGWARASEDYIVGGEAARRTLGGIDGWRP